MESDIEFEKRGNVFVVKDRNKNIGEIVRISFEGVWIVDLDEASLNQEELELIVQKLKELNGE